MHHLASTSRRLRSFMAFGTPSWWPSALARRVSPRFAAANPPTRHVSRFPHGSRNMASSSGLKGEELGRPDRQPVNPSAKDFIISLSKLSSSTQGMKNIENTDTANKVIAHHSYVPPANSAEDERRARGNVISGDKDASTTTLEVMDNKPDVTGETVDTTGCERSSKSWAEEISDDPMYEFILPYSSHRDGSIYTGTDRWKRNYRIADRNETRLVAMTCSDPTGCIIHNGTCMSLITRNMLQVFSLRLAKIPVEHGPVELYGYIAMRDMLEPLLNYVINFSRDDPIIVEQGSHISMAGPKRAIELVDTTLIEYDMKIKIGEHEEKDLQLIDGVSIVDDIDTWDRGLFTYHINGGCGAIDLTASRLNHAVQATIEVVISQVQGSFSMQLGCFTSGLDEEIRLFDGDIGEPRGLKRTVVAVVIDAHLDLKFKVGAESSIPAEHCRSFKVSKHCRATEEIKTNFALITVNVIWSTLA